MTTDYEQSGIPMDKPSVRVARLAESLAIMRAMWRDGSATFKGEHYQVTECRGHAGADDPGRPAAGDRRRQPARPRPGRRVRRHREHRAEPDRPATSAPEVAAESVVEKYADRVRWAREAAGSAPTSSSCSAGRSPCRWSRTPARSSPSLAPLFDLTPEQLRAAPLALIGTVEEIAECCGRAREQLGFSYIVVHEAEMDALAPVIAELAGT